MSAANAAARKRRAPNAILESTPRPNMPSSQPVSNVGLTLPQVIALIDKRLITLENHVKDNHLQVDSRSTTTTSDQTVSEVQMLFSQQLSEITEEFNSRYAILAEEIDGMKNMLLKLHSYTLEVNKTLMEERIRILSDVEKPQALCELAVQDLAENIGFSLSETISLSEPIDTELFEMEDNTI